MVDKFKINILKIQVAIILTLTILLMSSCGSTSKFAHKKPLSKRYGATAFHKYSCPSYY